VGYFAWNFSPHPFHFKATDYLQTKIAKIAASRELSLRAQSDAKEVIGKQKNSEGKLHAHTKQIIHSLDVLWDGEPGDSEITARSILASSNLLLRTKQILTNADVSRLCFSVPSRILSMGRMHEVYYNVIRVKMSKTKEVFSFLE
jgi:hypothetical protein